MLELLKKLPFWDLLSDDEKQMVSNQAVLRQYQQGNVLHGGCENDSCFGMFYIASGEIRTSILSDEGREITLYRLYDGDMCVLSASCVISQISFDTQMTVTKDAPLLIIPSSTFAKLIDSNIYARCFMYELAAERFSTVMWVMKQILFSRFDQRLAVFLLNEYRKTGIPEIRMTQEQIAQNVNSAREVVARMLKQFAADGLIENRRGVIVLKDIPKLEKLDSK